MKIKACVFDAYGTLFDVSAAARAAAAEPGHDALAEAGSRSPPTGGGSSSNTPGCAPSPASIRDFWQVTKDGLDWALGPQGLDDPRRCATRLLALYWELAAYPEVPDDAGASCSRPGIADRDPVERLARHAGRRGRARPGSATARRRALGRRGRRLQARAARSTSWSATRFDCARDEVLFVSSNGWDAAAPRATASSPPGSTAPASRWTGCPPAARRTADLSAHPRHGGRRSDDAASPRADGVRAGLRRRGRRPAGARACRAHPQRRAISISSRRTSGGRPADPDGLPRPRAVGLGRPRPPTRFGRRPPTCWRCSTTSGSTRAAILGTSRGGLIAMVLAATAKDRLSGVCLNDIGPVIDRAGLDMIRQLHRPPPPPADLDEPPRRVRRATHPGFTGRARRPLARRGRAALRRNRGRARRSTTTRPCATPSSQARAPRRPISGRCSTRSPGCRWR